MTPAVIYQSELILGALEKFNWNRSKPAEHLEIKHPTFQYNIVNYGLE